MNILERIKKEQLQARKDKNVKKSQLLTTLLGEFETISKGSKNSSEITTSEVFKIIEKFVKNNLQTIETIGPFHEKYNDLSNENEILVSYLPQQLSEFELKSEVYLIIDGLTEQNNKPNMGLVMKALKENFPNRYDGKMASIITKDVLSEF